MTVAAGKTLGYGKVGTCFLYVSSAKRTTLSEHDWDEYIKWFEQALQGVPKATGVVFERGDGPNATQRKQINDVTAKLKFRVAVFATSKLAHGLVTVMSWFRRDAYSAFQPEELDKAIKYLEIDAVSAGGVKQMVQKLFKELDA